MNNFKKGFGLPILLMILGLVILGGGAYWYIQNKQPAIPVDSGLQTATSTAQTSTATPQPSSPNKSVDFVVSPASGTAPLTANFSASGNLFYGNIEIDFGDGNKDMNPHTSTNGADQKTLSESHTYTSPGTYVAKLLGQECAGAPMPTCGPFSVLGSATITVTVSQSISVPGMSQYTDKDFGFSFWYPNSWTVSLDKQDTSTPVYLLLDSSGTVKLRVEKQYAASGSISYQCKASVAAVTYYFDSTIHAWMMTTPSGYFENGDKGPEPADVSDNTMGGLHLLGVGCGSYIVPLSAHNFLIVEDGGEAAATPLTDTITATDPSVATPVSAAQQTAIIQTEKTAYTGQ